MNSTKGYKISRQHLSAGPWANKAASNFNLHWSNQVSTVMLTGVDVISGWIQIRQPHPLILRTIPCQCPVAISSNLLSEGGWCTHYPQWAPRPAARPPRQILSQRRQVATVSSSLSRGDVTSWKDWLESHMLLCHLLSVFLSVWRLHGRGLCQDCVMFINISLRRSHCRSCDHVHASLTGTVRETTGLHAATLSDWGCSSWCCCSIFHISSFPLKNIRFSPPTMPLISTCRWSSGN